MTVDERYYVEKELGRGGMGIVYLGRDRRLHDKPVVLKVLLDEYLKNPWVLQKFEQEREALARVDHPGVVGILDTGKLLDEKLYIVMQYIDGRSLRQTIAAAPNGLDLTQAAKIIRQIGAALHAVHEKKIYHRDLKPENILLQRLSPIDEQVKIVDFGIAKVKDSLVAQSTITGAPGPGTVLYMSPEQLHGAPVTAASDVYAFGVTAYEILTGRRPFEALTIAQLADMQREGVREKPSDLRPQVTAEADAAILMALAFDDTKRYQSADEFGNALAAALVSATKPDKPFVSEPPPARRIVFPQPSRPAPAIESTTTNETTQPPKRAKAKTTRVALLLGVIVVGLLAGAFLFKISKSLMGRAKPPDLYVETGHWDDVMAMAFSSDGRMLATGGRDFLIRVWDVPTRREVKTLAGHMNDVTTIAFSPDGKLLASVAEKEEKVRIWNLATGAELKTFTGPTEARIRFSPDSEFLAVASSEGSVRLWNAVDGIEVRTFQTDADGEDVTSVAFSPDGKVLASIEPGDAIKLWDVPEGVHLRTIPLDHGSDGFVLFSGDGKTLWSYSTGVIKQWDVGSGKEVSSATVAVNQNDKVAFSFEKRFLASTSSNGAFLKVFDVVADRELEAPSVSENGSSVESMAFSPDGAVLAIGDDAGVVTLWDVANNKKLDGLEGHSFPAVGLAFGQDGKPVAAASADKTVKLWNLSDGSLTVLSGHSAAVSMVAFSPDGKTLASASEDGNVKLWDLSTNTEMKTLNPGGEIQGVAFSPNGTTVAIMSWNIQLWDIATDKELGAISFSDEKGFSVSFSHDGQLLAYGDGQAVKIWNVNTGSEFRSLSKHSAHVDWVAFSPNGKTLASSSDDRTIKIWDVVTGAELRTLRGHTAPVHTLAFSRDGKWLASTSVDKTIRIWDAATGSELKKIVLVSDFPGLPAFSPDGRMLVSGSLTGRTYLWDVSTGTNLASFIALDKNEWVVMTPDGRFDGSTNGLRFLHSVQDNKPISLDRFEDLHTPKLLQQVFAAN